MATITLAGAEKGNSFIPRPWARQHLEHLLEQGRTPRVKELIIGLSEDFQIITPYTSFLVLESDAHRERFAVKKKSRMLDAEEFFAKGKDNCQTRYMLDYTVPAMTIKALPKQTQHIRIGLLRTTEANNAFLKGHYDLCMSHPENHIVPCHMGCILNTVRRRKTDEVGPIDLDDVETLWNMGTERGFRNIDIDYQF